MNQNVNLTIDKFKNIPIAIGLLDNYDFETKTFVNGIYKGFKMDITDKGEIVIIKGSLSVTIDKEYMTVHVKPIEEMDISKHFIDLLADKCVDKIYNSALNNFKTRDDKRRKMKFNKTSLPNEVVEMPSEFFLAPFEREERSLSVQSGGYVVGIRNSRVTKNVIEELKYSVADKLHQKSRDFKQQESKYLESDFDAQEDLDDQFSTAYTSLFGVLNKQLEISKQTESTTKIVKDKV